MNRGRNRAWQKQYVTVLLFSLRQKDNNDVMSDIPLIFKLQNCSLV